MGEDQKEAGRIPRTIDCELTHDLGEFFQGLLHHDILRKYYNTSVMLLLSIRSQVNKI
jgi:hypothetical protein